MDEEMYKSLLGAALDENTRWASQDLADLASILRDHQRSNQRKKAQVERLHQLITKERQETAVKKKRNQDGWRRYVTWAKGEIVKRDNRIVRLETIRKETQESYAKLLLVFDAVDTERLALIVQMEALELVAEAAKRYFSGVDSYDGGVNLTEALKALEAQP